MIQITKAKFKCFERNFKLRQYVEEKFDSIFHLCDGATQVKDEVTLGDIITLICKRELLGKDLFLFPQIILRASCGCRQPDS